LKSKLFKIVNNSNIDNVTKNHLLDNIEFFREKYNDSKDEFGLMQSPSNFLFGDFNFDGIEDLIFQSNGPFIFDSYVFLLFLSSNESKYRFVDEGGQIIDIEISEQFCCRFGPGEEKKYMKVDFCKSGCCDNPWDRYLTGILDLSNGPFTDDLFIINLKSINRTAERLELKSK